LITCLIFSTILYVSSRRLKVVNGQMRSERYWRRRWLGTPVEWWTDGRKSHRWSADRSKRSVQCL